MKHYIYITITTTKSQVSTTLNCLQPAARSRSTAFYHHCRSCLSRAGFYASPVHSTKMFQALQQHCQHSQLEVSRKLEVGKLDPRSVWTGQVCHGIAAACQTSPTNLITPDGEGWIDPSISPRPSGISTSTSSDSGSTWKLQAGGSSWELLYQMSHACHAWCQETLSRDVGKARLQNISKLKMNFLKFALHNI